MMRLTLLGALIALLAGCGGGTSAPEDAAPAETVALAGEKLEGGRLSLADFRGRPVFVNVWASW
jgi:hypothetical protein